MKILLSSNYFSDLVFSKANIENSSKFELFSEFVFFSGTPSRYQSKNLASANYSLDLVLMRVIINNNNKKAVYSGDILNI